MTQGPQDHRRYSESEFAVILRKASELQASGESARVRSGGLSLDEIQQIAEEAGIDPALIARAAALVDSGDPSLGGSAILGPSGSVHVSATIDGELSTEALSRLMEVVRYEVRQPGSVHEVLGSVAWKSDSTETAMEVRLTPRDGRTNIEILSDHKAIKTLFYVLGGTVGMLAGIISLPLLGVPKAVVMVGGLVVGPALGALGARPLWAIYANKLRGKVARLMGMLEEEGTTRVIAAGTDEESS